MPHLLRQLPLRACLWRCIAIVLPCAAVGALAIAHGSPTAVSAIVVGAGPQAVAVNPVTRRIYVVVSGSGAVIVLDDPASSAADTRAARVLGDVPHPGGIAVDPVSHDLSVTESAGNTLATLQLDSRLWPGVPWDSGA